VPWKMRLDIEDDRPDGERPSLWRRRLALASLIGLASLWVVAIAVLAAWLAGVVVR
jgi:hypothetical protein